MPTLEKEAGSASPNASNPNWRESKEYSAAVAGSEFKREMLSSPTFQKLADKWPAAARRQFLIAINNTENFTKLFNAEVFNTMPRVSDWNPECIGLLLKSIYDTGEVKKLTSPDFIEAAGKLGKGADLTNLKTFFGALSHTGAIDEMTNPEYIEMLSRKPKTAIFSYLWELSSNHTKLFMGFEEWESSNRKEYA